MKKSKILTVFMAGAMLVSVSACGKEVGEVVVDSSKYQINAFAVENGVGHQWLVECAAKWNQMNPDSKFQVIPQTGAMALHSGLDAMVEAKTTDINMYFGSQRPSLAQISKGIILDVSDVYNMSVDADGKKISEKTHYYEDLKVAFSDLKGNGMYMIPYASGMTGLVFDYGFFAENDYLYWATAADLNAVVAQEGAGSAEVDGDKLVAKKAFGNYEVGDRISRAGKDGKYGTYDDGQAITQAEFNDTLTKILNDGNFAYLYATSIIIDAYQRPFLEAIFAQTMGYDNYKTLMAFDGELKGADGVTQATLTEATGKIAYDTDIVKQSYKNAVEFYRNNMMGLAGEINGTAYTPQQIISTYSYGNQSLRHTDAQGKFVMSFADESNNPSAFLMEGSWWEYEAKTYLDLAKKDENYGENGRDYRFYLFPRQEGQVDDRSVIACQDDGAGVLFNNTPKKVKDAGLEDEFILECKKFMAFTLSNENLAMFTKNSGVSRPFDYEMSESDLANLSYFQRNNWELSHDTENVVVLADDYVKRMSKVRLYSEWNDYKTDEFTRGGLTVDYLFPFQAFTGENPVSAADYVKYVLQEIQNTYDAKYSNVQNQINK